MWQPEHCDQSKLIKGLKEKPRTKIPDKEIKPNSIPLHSPLRLGEAAKGTG